ncbi:G protein-coupled receptor gpr1 [Paraconiothyrium brasiliense]|uniref:G protein-coupled receptor gpr1 n=1 Tax=Paraconiothyrium brasiliense TaxID=300254 RepID=A0ABR3R1U1_9PLEO
MPNVRNIKYLRVYRLFNLSSVIYSYVPMLFTAASLFTKAVSSPVPDVSHYNGPATFQIYNPQGTYNMRVAAAACAAISVVASFIVIYWFCRMEKRFRHRLIMLLIVGDLMKAMWLFLQAVLSLARGTTNTESAFCQSSGFLVQFGTEESDFAVLCIAVHSALQVFRPSNMVHSEGLSPYRYYVYIGALIIPALMAALALINPRWGYMSQGPYCSLPLRPFWYRLALQWIPRYMITIIILALAIAIYAHVGFEFRSILNPVKDTKPSVSSITQDQSVDGLEDGLASGPELSQYQVNQFRRDSSVVSMMGASRRVSGVATVGSHPEIANDLLDRCYMLPELQTYDTANMGDASIADKENEPPGNGSGDKSDGNTSPLSEEPSQHLERQLAQKRTRIHRQLRLMFIYPIVYILIWLFPFINHCMTYKDEFAAHPLYWLSLINVICLTSMGAVDCLVFSLRERPWRHIPSSDGSFLGSFMWWHTFPHANSASLPPYLRPDKLLPRTTNPEATPCTPLVQREPEGWRGGMMRTGRNAVTHSRNSSSEYARTQAGMARMRLMLEKEDRRLANKASEDEMASRMPKGGRGSTFTGLETIESPAEEKKVELGVMEERMMGDAEASAGGEEQAGGQSGGSAGVVLEQK